MKIIGFDCNYCSDTAVEAAGSPVRLDIADSALMQGEKPFFLPDFDQDFRAFPSIAVKINRLGKGVAPRFASRYYGQIAIGLNIRAMGLLERLRRQGEPWSEAVSFDSSAVFARFQDWDPSAKLPQVSIFVDGRQVSLWDPDCLREGIDQAIARASAYSTLKTGDIIFPGFPTQGIRLSIGETLTAEAEGLPSLFMRIK